MKIYCIYYTVTCKYMTVAREFMETDARATGVLLGCVCSLDLEAKEYTSVSSVFPGSALKWNFTMAWLNDSPGPNIKSSSFLVIAQVQQNCLTKQDCVTF